MINRVPSMRAAGPVRGRTGAEADGVSASALSSRGGARGTRSARELFCLPVHYSSGPVNSLGVDDTRAQGLSL